MNQVTLVGRLTNDVVLRKTKNSKSVVNFAIITASNFKCVNSINISSEDLPF